MSQKPIAPNGQEITDEMIDRWCEAYERGEFPEGEHSIGPVVMGQPQRSASLPLVAQDGKPVTDETIAGWEAALDRDEWPSGRESVGEVTDGRLPGSKG